MSKMKNEIYLETRVQFYTENNFDFEVMSKFFQLILNILLKNLNNILIVFF